MTNECRCAGSSSFAGRVRSVKDIYRRIDEETAGWIAACAVPVCHEGCGFCCEGFIPEITRSEAECIVDFLLETGKELVVMPERHKATQCPYFVAEGIRHCTIYPARPLTCRSFGFTSTLDKEGRERFSFCKKLSLEGKRHFNHTEIRNCFVFPPPLVTHFGTELVALDPGLLVTEPIQQAVIRALESCERHRYYEGLKISE